MKALIKSIPVVGDLAVGVFRFFYYRLNETQAPGSARARASVRHALALAVEYVYAAEVEGDLAEFGTMSGETAERLARSMAETEAMYRKDVSRRLHLFDSFKGLPQPSSPVDKDSPHVRSGTWTAGACMVLTKDRLRFKISRVLPESRFAIWDGWFKETTAALPAGATFALVHADCDFYESTMDALGPLFRDRRLSHGAIILFDDWNTNRALPEFGQRRAWKELCERHRVSFSDEGSYAVCGRKFIVHGYS